MITGQSARCSSPWTVEPRRIPVQPPRPRRPTTRRTASCEARASCSAGCPRSTSSAMPMSGYRSAQPAMHADTRCHSTSPSSASSCERRERGRTMTARSRASRRLASSTANATASWHAVPPSTPTTSVRGWTGLCSGARTTTTGQSARATSGMTTDPSLRTSAALPRRRDPTTARTACAVLSCSTVAGAPSTSSVAVHNPSCSSLTRSSALTRADSARIRSALRGPSASYRNRSWAGGTAATSLSRSPRRTASSAAQTRAGIDRSRGSTPNSTSFMSLRTPS